MASRALGTLLASVALVACGDRSGLELDDSVFATDASIAPQDAGVSPARDATTAPGADADPDATTRGPGLPDALPPPPDSSTRSILGPDAAVVCDDGGFPLAYVIDSSGAFYTFDPSSLATNLIGTPACGDTSGVWDFSVSREGNAYVIFEDWSIFKVDLRTLACTPTAFVNGQLALNGNFTSAVLQTAQGEEMIYYGASQTDEVPILARSDITSFVVTSTAALAPPPPGGNAVADIKANALGQLFGLTSGGVFLEIDPTSATIEQAQATSFASGSWALLLFGRDVYFFGNSTVYRYDPSTTAVTELGTVGPTVVGASAVPCLHVP